MSTNRLESWCTERTWSWLLIGLLACPGCGRLLSREVDEDDCAWARTLIAQGAGEQAIDGLDKLIAANPRHARAVFHRAWAYEKIGRHDLALAGYTEALRLDDEIMAPGKIHLNGDPRQGVPLGIKPAEVYCRQGMLLNERGRSDSAIQAFGEALQTQPNCAEARYGRAVAFLAKGFPELAFDDLTEALRFKPQYAEALSQRARAATLKGDARQAMEDCHAAILADPQQPFAYRVLGSVHASQSPPALDRALAYLQEAVRLDPSSAAEVRAQMARIWFDRAIALRGAGEEAEAQQALAKATALEEKYGPMYAQHVAKLTLSKSGPQVVTVLRPIEPNPAVVELANQGSTLSNQGQWEAAIQEFTKAIAADPKHAPSYYGRGVAFLKNGFPDTAVEDFSEAVHLDKSLAKAWNERANAYVMTGECYLAAEDATRAIRLDPRLSTAYQHRAMAYVKTDRFDQAIADAQKAVSLDANLQVETQVILAEAYRGRARLALSRKQPQAALNDLHEAIRIEPRWVQELRPQLAEALRIRALQLARQSEFAPAITDLTEALRQYANDPESLKERGFVYFKMQKWDLAAVDLAKAVELDPRLTFEARWHLAESQRRRDATAYVGK